MIFHDILNHAQKFAAHLVAKSHVIHEVMREYQSYEVVNDEIRKSVDALTSLSEISSYYSDANLTHQISVFLPLNLPLYSFVLFAIMPSYQASKVIVRPPERMNDIFAKLSQKLEFLEYYPGIEIFTGARKDFVEDYCKKSSVVLFTGKYKNFLTISKQCNKDTLILFNGSGHNPIVLTPSANIDFAVEKTTYVKLFNSGQDCAGPDCILVHDSIADEFILKLQLALNNTALANSYMDDSTIVGPLFEKGSLTDVIKFIFNCQSNGAEITHGGKVDFRYNLMHPCILEVRLSQMRNFSELYSPLFFIARYANDYELNLYFNDIDGSYQSRQMYISLFGESSVVENSYGSIILKNRTIHDIERGTEEYGGYGSEASSISYRGIIIHKPLLIPREISNFLFHDWSADIFNDLPKYSPEQKQLALSTQFKKIVQQIFGEELVFAYIFGSFASGKDTPFSDIDTLICVRNRKSQHVKEYLQWLFFIHELFGRIPDLKYPSEIITLDEISKASNVIQTLSLKATKNEIEKYDAMVWFHSLSQLHIGTVFPENIPVQWQEYFPMHESRLLSSFLRDIDEMSKKSENFFQPHIQIDEMPRDNTALSTYLSNLNKRGLINVLKMIPFEEAPQHTDIVLQLLMDRPFMGRSLFDATNQKQLYDPCFRFGVVAP